MLINLGNILVAASPTVLPQLVLESRRHGFPVKSDLHTRQLSIVLPFFSEIASLPSSSFLPHLSTSINHELKNSQILKFSEKICRGEG